jgi:formylglycine-generating enzyme required for sulfatase activity
MSKTPEKPFVAGSSQDEIGDAAIEPAEFVPVSGNIRKKRFKPSKALLTLLVATLIATPVLYFLFAAQSIVVTTKPIADRLQLSGGMILPLGNRHLLLPGSYELHMELEGHFPLQEQIEVTAEKGQQFGFTFSRLPDLLTINSEPAKGAMVSLDEIEVGQTPLGNIKLLPGEHHLQISLPRYQAYSEILQIEGGGNTLDITRQLVPAWSEVSINSMPAGATVSVDGEERGITPAVMEIIEGKHTLTIKAAGYNAWNTSLELTANQPLVLPMATLEKADGLLIVNTRPQKANILVDGQFTGQSSLELNLAPGKTYQIEAFKAGYQNIKRTITIESGREQTLTLPLKVLLGEIVFNTNPGNVIFTVNGSPKKLKNGKLLLPASPQDITVSKQGYVPYTTTITPKPGFAQRVDIQLKTLAQAKWEAIKPSLTSSDGQTLKLFRSARFTMGASRREPGRRANEVLHEVEITRPYYLATREVTNKQFREFKPGHSSGRFDTHSLNDDNQPVVNISWIEAARYCNWLSKKDGLKPAYTISGDKLLQFDGQANGYRLPTEAEWSWAARGTKAGLLKYPWGSDFPPADNQGNYADRTVASLLGRLIPNYDDGQAVSAPVASYKANSHGLFDMGGNVAEWINDYYGQISLSGKKAAVDPTGPETGGFHVIRGSSWRHGTVVELRLSFRDYGGKARDDIGFRIARYAE